MTDRPRERRFAWTLFADPPDAGPTAAGRRAGDRRDGAVYIADDDLEMAVKVALITGRPLLLRGEPGFGKSTFAIAVARRLGWAFYEHVVTSRTEARDLLYRFDAVRRLADATARSNEQAQDPRHYVEPGPLWWALNPEQASTYGRDDGAKPRAKPDRNPDPGQARAKHHRADLDPDGAVVLIDEIDKAEADLANDLLVPFGALRFRVDEADDEVSLEDERRKADQPRLLLVVTTNEERDLPPAFLRRCVIHRITLPSADDPEERREKWRAYFTVRAEAHFADAASAEPERFEAVCAGVFDRLDALNAERHAGQRLVSVAEYLDAVDACLTLGVDVDSAEWPAIERLTLAKGADR